MKQSFRHFFAFLPLAFLIVLSSSATISWRGGNNGVTIGSSFAQAQPWKRSARKTNEESDSYDSLMPPGSFANTNQFNGGYDAGRGVHWNPLEAAEFLLWHAGEAGEAGKQLRPLIEHWRGSDAGEFLTRLYLGETNEEEFKLSFESRNVRNPQWKGLDDEDGLKALKDLLSSALPDEVLAPAEIARLADSYP